MLHKLRKFLTLPVGRDGDVAVVSGARRPMGYVAVTQDAVTAAKLVLPAAPANSGLKVGYVVIQNSHATVALRWRDDGTAPTTSAGMRLVAGAELDYAGDPTMIQFIAESSTVTINVSYYA